MQANADSLGREAALGRMHYVQLAKSSMNSFASEQQITEGPSFALCVTKKIHIWDGRENAGRGVPRD